MSAEAYVQALTGWAALLRLLYQQPQAGQSGQSGPSWPAPGLDSLLSLQHTSNTCAPTGTIPTAATAAAVPLGTDMCAAAALVSPFSNSEREAPSETPGLSGGPVKMPMRLPASAQLPALMFGEMAESGGDGGIGAVPMPANGATEWPNQPLALHSLLQLRLIGLGLGTAFEGGSLTSNVLSASPGAAAAAIGNGGACSMHNVSSGGLKTAHAAASARQQPPRPNPHPKPPFSYIALITMVCCCATACCLVQVQYSIQ